MLISVWSSDVCSSDLADVGDEPAEMPRDLRVGGLIVVGSGRHGAGFAKLIDLDDVRDDAALHRLPYQRRRQAGCEHQAAERHEPPIHCLRSEEHTSELQSLMRITYAVFCLKKKKKEQTVIS